MLFSCLEKSWLFYAHFYGRRYRPWLTESWVLLSRLAEIPPNYSLYKQEIYKLKFTEIKLKGIDVIYNKHILTLTRFWGDNRLCLFTKKPSQIHIPKMELIKNKTVVSCNIFSNKGYRYYYNIWNNTRRKN